MTRAEFKDIFDLNFKAVRNYIYYRSGDSEIATDIAQETFLRIWEKQPADTDRISGLLFKIAGDLFISHYRRQKLMEKFRLSYKADKISGSPEDLVLHNELKDRYEAALVNLPEKQRIVFLMSRLDQLTYPEIADRLGLSVKAVEKRMSLALSYLKKTLGQ